MWASFSPSFFKRLQQLKIHTRRKFIGKREGSHLSKQRGHGIEFSDYRAYAPGDDFRHIDWGVYGRTDRLYIRQFREEQEINVLFFLDASASMSFPESQSKFNLAKQIAFSLGYAALTDGDNITFSSLGNRAWGKFSGGKSVSRAEKFLSMLEISEGVMELEEEIRAGIERQKLPAKCFFISDFLAPLEEIFNSLNILRAKNFEITAIQLLSPNELEIKDRDLRFVRDAETGELSEVYIDDNSMSEYKKLLSGHLEQIETYCFRAGINYILLSSQENVEDIVLNKFPAAGLLR